MFGQKARKRLEKEAKAKEKAQRCACGNFCGSDGLCNACRSAKVAKATGYPANGTAVASSAPTRRARLAASTQKEPRSKAESAKRAVLIGCPDGIEDDVLEYLGDTAADLLASEHVSPEEFEEELKDSFLPILEQYEVAPEAATGLCKFIHRAAFPAVKAIRKTLAKPKSAESGDFDADLLCRVPNLMLMYGGSTQPLLKDAVLDLVRGHRYGIVGANGSGKTTLMARIACKDIEGFPQDIRVVHLRHEAILDGISSRTTAREYAQVRSGGNVPEEALRDVGFDESGFLDKAVVALSGGWQMRLALACAMAQQAQLLLLDEPTNHLDTDGVSWLADFINRVCVDGERGSTAMIVSHDPVFLDRICTDVIHFTSKGKLAYHTGNFAQFTANELGGNESEAKRLLEITPTLQHGIAPDPEDRMAFPAPEKLGENAAARKAPVITFKCGSFQYIGAARPVLRDVDIQVFQSSRIGIIGKNGSGKSTLLSLLADRMQPSSIGDVVAKQFWRHKQLRLAYVAQNCLVHLGDYLDNTPLEYVQARFARGFDQEAPIKTKPPMATAEKEKMRSLGIRHGKRGKQVESLLSRIDWIEGNERLALYEVKWMDLSTAENSFETSGYLHSLGASQLVAEIDENLWNAWAGADQRPLSTCEVVQHLEPFGLSEEVICGRKISMLSSGQKSKLAYGAAFWTRPHILCLDEPTNYLDVETVRLLQRAISAFRGGCVIVSHNDAFIAEVSKTILAVEDGHIIIHKMSK